MAEEEAGFSHFDATLIILAMLGVWIGSIIGAMSQIIPFVFVVLVGILNLVVLWQFGTLSLLILGAYAGAMIGSFLGFMQGITSPTQGIPLGIPIYLMCCLVLMMFRGKVFGGVSQTVPSLVIVPVLILTIIGLFYNFTYVDFCIVFAADTCANPSNWVNGFATTYVGCFADCGGVFTGISIFNIFGSSIFFNFILLGVQGNYIGMVASLFIGSFQNAITIIAFVFAVALVLLGSGIGLTWTLPSVLGFGGGGGGVTINEAGTRFYQSMGFATILYAVVFGSFGGWIIGAFPVFGNGASNLPIIGLGFFSLITSMFFYGAYLQGKTVGA